MNLIDKDIITAASFAAKSELRPILQCVKVDSSSYTATDGFKLIHIKNRADFSVDDFPLANCGEPVRESKEYLLKAKQIQTLKFPSNPTFPILKCGILNNNTDKTVSVHITDMGGFINSNVPLEKVEGQFPDWETILPKDEPMAHIHVDAERLVEVLKAFIDKGQGQKSTQAVSLAVYGDTMPLVIKGVVKHNDNKLALLMPCKQ